MILDPSPVGDGLSIAHASLLRNEGVKQIPKWSGREDSNLRPLPPEDSALPG